MTSHGHSSSTLSDTSEHVREETRLVWAGYFRSESELEAEHAVRFPPGINPSVIEVSAGGPSDRPANADALEQLGREMHMTAERLQMTHQQEFDELMGELGSDLTGIINGLRQVFAQFLSPSNLTWGKIATFFAFSIYVLSKLFKKGVAAVSSAVESTSEFLSNFTSTLLDSMSQQNVFSWIASRGGWESNRDNVLTEMEEESSSSSSMFRRMIPNSDSFSNLVIGGGIVLGAAAVTGMVLYRNS